MEKISKILLGKKTFRIHISEELTPAEIFITSNGYEF